MSNRRTFLKSALFLPPLLSAKVFAQDNTDSLLPSLTRIHGRPALFADLAVYGTSATPMATHRRTIDQEVSARFSTVLKRGTRLLLGGDIRYVPGENEAYHASSMTGLCDRVAAESGRTLSGFQKQFLAARLLAVYLSAYATYDNELATAGSEQQNARGKPSAMLAMPSLRYICSGISNLYQSIANAFSGSYRVECRYVGGWQRLLGDNPVTWESNHAWNAVTFGNGLTIPLDITGFALNRKGTPTERLIGRWILPTDPVGVELFHARNYGYYRHERLANEFPDDRGKDKSPLLDMPFKEWAVVDTTRLIDVERAFINSVPV